MPLPDYIHRPRILALGFGFFILVLFGVRGIFLGADPFLSFLRVVPSALVCGSLAFIGLVLLNKLQTKKLLYILGAVSAISLPSGYLTAKVGNTMVFAVDKMVAGTCRTIWCLDFEEIPSFAEAVTGNFFIYSLLFLLHFWLRSIDDVRTAERREAAARNAAQEAQILALRYQVNPHFLFNSLNSLATLIDRGDPDAAKAMIREMSGFLRYGLASDPVADAELEDEVEMQRRYLEIERLRFSHRLTLAIEMDDEVRHARVPSLILQPLVENAVKHGVASTSAPVTVTIRAKCVTRDSFTLSVEDNAPTGGVATGGLGIGLRNVADRLRLRFGEAGTLATLPNPRGGFQAILTMPLLRS